MRWIAIVLLALIAISHTAEMASASKRSPVHPQNRFVQACRESGGQPQRVGSHIVRCTLNDGATITCNFNFDPPVCHYAVEGIVVWNETTPDPTQLLFTVPQAPVLDVSAPETSAPAANDGSGQVNETILKKEHP